jgi:selenide,water dikinase
VLIGGGHVHLTVLKRFGMRPLPGVRLTLVSRTSQSPYSGMLPGLIAGHYTADEMHFDLRVLADFAHTRFIRAEVIGLEAGGRRILCRDRRRATPEIGSVCGASGAATRGQPAPPVPRRAAAALPRAARRAQSHLDWPETGHRLTRRVVVRRRGLGVALR